MNGFLHSRVLVTALLLGLGADASFLPSFAADAADAHSSTSLLDADNKWWTQVGGRVFHAPEKSSALSSDIGSYYYAIGSDAGVPAALKQHRVGGEGRWHIFHLPAGSASMLQTTTEITVDRRASMSKLKKLEHGAVLSTRFPEYKVDPHYKHPLNKRGKALETRAVNLITPDRFEGYLKDITSLDSRSYTSEADTLKAISLVEKEFKNMNYDVCRHSFGQGKLQNVVAFQRGKQPGSLIVGAHYDSRPYSGKAPGAEDNGSGVAGLLAMARAMKDAGFVPKKSVYFVAFAGEEGGMIGSSAFAQAVQTGEGLPEKCTVPASSLIEINGEVQDNVEGAIIMDEIGWVSKSEVFPKGTVNLEAFESNKGMMDHMYSACQDQKCGLDIIHNGNPFGSDHMSFKKAVLTINGDDEAYPNYHMKTDTIENVNVTYGSLITKMNMGALIRMAGVAESSFLQQKRN